MLSGAHNGPRFAQRVPNEAQRMVAVCSAQQWGHGGVRQAEMMGAMEGGMGRGPSVLKW